LSSGIKVLRSLGRRGEGEKEGEEEGEEEEERG
jgi:hypothetical protein